MRAPASLGTGAAFVVLIDGGGDGGDVVRVDAGSVDASWHVEAALATAVCKVKASGVEAWELVRMKHEVQHLVYEPLVA